MSNVPTNVRDFDSYVVARFVEIREDYENSTVDASVEAILEMVVRGNITFFIEEACERANVEYGNFSNVLEQAIEDYINGFGSGSQRRSVLFKMCADVRAIISTLPQLEPKIEFSKKISDDDMDQILGKIKSIDFSKFKLVGGNYVGSSASGMKRNLIGDPKGYIKNITIPADPYRDIYQTLHDADLNRWRGDEIDREHEEFLAAK